MHNFSNEKPPKPPVITSLASALNRIDAWQKENQYDRIHDLEGMEWQVSLDVAQAAHESDSRRLCWHLKIKVSTNATVEDFIRTGTFDAVEDERILSLIGEESVPLSMKPITYEASSEDEARQIVANALPRLKASFPKNSLDEIKRSLVGRWVDEGGFFR